MPTNWNKEHQYNNNMTTVAQLIAHLQTLPQEAIVQYLLDAI
jgi:sulfur carrier protein ThiS